MSRYLPIVLVSLALLSTGCSKAKASAPTPVEGACASVFGAEVCTWATTNNGALIEAGATIPMAAIEQAPTSAPMTWPPVPSASVALPNVVRTQTALKQLTINWEAGGHPPASFLTPHFDFHFYTITPAEITAIDCKDERKPSALPAAYALPDIPLPPHMAHMMGVPALVGLCVPHMGMHGIPAADIARTDAFEGTMVVGYYRGQLIFVEPMIAKATLMRKTSFDLPVPVVPGFTGVLPKTFRADYDAAAQAYRFRLAGFKPAS